MRIAHYAQGLRSPGGLATYIRCVSEEQSRRGDAVLYYDLERYRERQPEGSVEIRYIHDTADLFRHAQTDGVELLHVHAVLDLAAPPPIPTVRSVHGHQPYCPAGLRYLPATGKPCERRYSRAGCLASHWLTHCGSIRPAKLAAEFAATEGERRSLPHLLSIAVSGFVRGEMIRSGYPADRVVALHSPVLPVEPLPPPAREERVRFLYLGRLARTKGVDWLLHALARLPSHIILDVAGSGEAEGEIRDLARRLRLEARVNFLGWQPADRVRELLAGCRALVFPSVWHEPAGLSLLEAMAYGRTVVASRVGGVPEFVEHGVNGLLVDPRDTPALCSAIDRLANDVELAAALAWAGTERVRLRHSLREHVTRLEELYLQEAARSGRPLVSAIPCRTARWGEADGT